jgi:hypothetical protein
MPPWRLRIETRAAQVKKRTSRGVFPVKKAEMVGQSTSENTHTAVRWPALRRVVGKRRNENSTTPARHSRFVTFHTERASDQGSRLKSTQNGSQFGGYAKGSGNAPAMYGFSPARAAEPAA